MEHRAAASTAGLRLALAADGDALALRVVDAAVPAEAPTLLSPMERVAGILADHGAPMTQREIRELAKIRAATVSDALAALVTDGRAERSDGRYHLVAR